MVKETRNYFARLYLFGNRPSFVHSTILLLLSLLTSFFTFDDVLLFGKSRSLLLLSIIRRLDFCFATALVRLLIRRFVPALMILLLFVGHFSDDVRLALSFELAMLGILEA